MKKPVNFTIFASGNGSNAENIIRYFADPSRGGATPLVVSNRREAGVLDRASRLGVKARHLPSSSFRNPEELLPLLRSHDTDVIVLAGFLLMIPDWLIKEYEGRIVNIHPSLLPKFGGKGMYGAHVHEAVKAAGETETGITIHHVTTLCDEGAPIFQARVDLSPSDTPADIERKVHALEAKHYPRILEETFISSRS